MANLNLQDKKFITPENLKLIINYGLGFASRVKNLEDKEIAPFEADKIYVKDSLTIYDGYIYKAKVTNQSSTFNEIYWELIGDEITELTKSDVEAMLGLTTEEIETLSKIILDSEVRLDKTFSSSKIYTDIQNAIQTSKDYTLTELSKMSGASYKVVTSTSEMINESIIYLLPNATNYDMYIVEEGGTVTKIGDTAINLDNYFTKTEITDNYYDKATCDGKFATITTVDGKVDQADLDTHIGDTTIHITQAEKDSYVLKSEVLTMDNVAHIKRFDSVPGNDWNNAIEEGFYSIPFDSIAETIANRPYDYATQIRVIRADANDPNFVYQIAFICASDNRIYIREQKIDGKWTSWKIIATTSVADVGKTTITPASSSVTGTIKYTVKNGICYVSFKGVKSTTNGTFSISTTMPKSDISCSIGIISDVANYDTGCAYIDENTTKLNITFYSTNYAGSCSFSYPVAES